MFQVLLLAPFVWKKLVGEEVTWTRDYVSVDEAEVLSLGHLSKMDEATFASFFTDKMWCAVLSNERVAQVKEGGAEMPLLFEERLTYVEMVQQLRLQEFDKQVLLQEQ